MLKQQEKHAEKSATEVLPAFFNAPRKKSHLAGARPASGHFDFLCWTPGPGSRRLDQARRGGDRCWYECCLDLIKLDYMQQQTASRVVRFRFLSLCRLLSCCL